MKANIHEQKDENEALYKQLLSLKKETANSNMRLALFKAKIELLERTLGVSKFNQEMEEAGMNIPAPYKGSVYQT